MSESLVADRLDAFRRQRRVHAGSLILSVFGDAILPRGGRTWLGSLIRLLAPLGLSERLVRTAVFRLVKEEWLATESRGRRSDYFLTPAGRRRFDEAARRIYASEAPQWDRRWRLILVVGALDARTRERLRRALVWQGCGALGPDCYVHPSADVAAVGDALLGEGLAAALPALLPLYAADARTAASASDADLVRRAWDLHVLAGAYGGFVAVYRPILEELRRGPSPAIAPQDALLLRVLLIHDYRRLLLRDPQLPEVLLPSEWPGLQARLLCRDIYRRLEPLAARHLDEVLSLADGSHPAQDAALPERFPEHVPLGADEPAPEATAAPVAEAADEA